MLHRFALADLSASPWKNGGGSTREIVCRPPGAGMDGFDWRVSVATIARSGPFSVFTGVDRVIVLGAEGLLADGPPQSVLGARAAELADAGVWVPGIPAAVPPRAPA